MRKLFDWLDHRTGYRTIVHETLYETVPGGARWRYVWGSTLVFCFVLQVITGIFLWTAYSPSVQTAWESVYYIQHQMYLGSLVRGIHHFAAQLMVVLLAFHLMQVIIDRAYQAPREVNFWLGLILMQIVLALSLTGYLLPWDQKGYYATQVSTKILGATPGVGIQLQELVQGGPEYGHHTLTRFFAMHAGVLPALLVAFLCLHLYVFRRHGLKVPDPTRGPTVTFWPDQLLRDSVACLGVLAVILLCVVFKGAELSGPANPSEAYSAARPEWYFLFLFRFLRFEAVEHFGLAFGAIYVPAAVMTLIVLMPLIALIRGGHRFNVAFAWVLMVAIVGLTLLSVFEDRADESHQAAIAEADRDAHRVVELAQLPRMIPVEGAGALLRDDPFTQGPRLFAKYCAACHRYDGHDGRGRMVMQPDPNDESQQVAVLPTAADLHGFAGRDWWRKVLTDYRSLVQPASRSGFDLELSESEGMLSWFDDSVETLRDEANQGDLAAMIEYLVSLNGRTDLDLDSELVERGAEIVSTGELTNGSIRTCDECHISIEREFPEEADNGGIPELSGYGSKQWLTAFISDPGTPQFFGDRNQMPAFHDKLSPKDLNLLARWLAGDYPPTHVKPYRSRTDELQTAIEAQSSSGTSTEAGDANGTDTSTQEADD